MFRAQKSYTVKNEKVSLTFKEPLLFFVFGINQVVYGDMMTCVAWWASVIRGIVYNASEKGSGEVFKQVFIQTFPKLFWELPKQVVGSFERDLSQNTRSFKAVFISYDHVQVGVRISNFIDCYTRSWKGGLGEEYMRRKVLIGNKLAHVRSSKNYKSNDKELNFTGSWQL